MVARVVASVASAVVVAAAAVPSTARAGAVPAMAAITVVASRLAGTASATLVVVAAVSALMMTVTRVARQRALAVLACIARAAEAVQVVHRELVACHIFVSGVMVSAVRLRLPPPRGIFKLIKLMDLLPCIAAPAFQGGEQVLCVAP